MVTTTRRFNPEFYYHIFNRGVDKRIIFSTHKDYKRFMETLSYYKYRQPVPYSTFLELGTETQKQQIEEVQKKSEPRIKIVSHCIMPNHFHMLLKPVDEWGITSFMSDVENSYTRYFNIKNERSGVLLQGPFKSVEVSNEPSVLQVTRYTHINPTVSSKVNIGGIVDKPEEYLYSSYTEWIGIKPYFPLVDRDEVDRWVKLVGGVDKYKAFVESKTKLGLPPGSEELFLQN